VRQASGITEVEHGDLTDTGSSFWRIRPACAGAPAAQRSSAATRTAWALVGSSSDGVVDSGAGRRASGGRPSEGELGN
jgi:hypothetical protein